MTSCVYIKGKKRKICTGDLNRKIKISVRQLKTGSTIDSVDYLHDFENVIDVWAMLNTTRGSQFFDGTNLQNAVTHEFYIRYIDIDTINWIEYKNVRYRIVDIENLDERSEFLKISAIVRGEKDLNINESGGNFDIRL